MVSFDGKDRRRGSEIRFVSQKASCPVVCGYANIFEHESTYQECFVTGEGIEGRPNARRGCRSIEAVHQVKIGSIHCGASQSRTQKTNMVQFILRDFVNVV